LPVKRISLLISFCWNVFICTAQELQPKYLLFDHLNISDGLSQGMINCMLQDKYGFMWFGTKDGLNRYDGYQFVVYRHDPMDTTSIGDNFIQSIYEDAEGRLWIGTSNRGLDLFIRESETFIHFRHDENDDNTLSDNRIDLISNDKNGDIWVSTLNGLNRIQFIKENTQKTSYRVTRYFTGFTRALVAGDGCIWGSIFQQFTFRFHPDSIDRFGADTINLRLFTEHEDPKALREIMFWGVAQDIPAKKLYLVTQYAVSEIDLSTNREVLVYNGTESMNLWGRTLCVDDNKKIWLSTMDGLRQFDVTEQKWYKVLPENPELQVPIQNTSITYKDRSGIIWIGTRGYGLLKYNPRSEKFYRNDYESIAGMHATNDNKVIVIKNTVALSLFDPATGSYPLIVHDADILHSHPQLKELEQTSSVNTNGDGIFWMTSDCLSSFDTATGKYRQYNNTDQWNFPAFIDHRGRIWSGTKDLLSCFDPATEQFKTYSYPVPVLRRPYEFLQCMYQDGSGIFWLGTLSGLLRFDQDKNVWEQFSFNAKDTTSLSFDVIFSICPDPKQPERYLWIGTDGGGLNRFDKQDKKFIHYKMKDGLPNDVIYGIQSDNQGNLWLSTNNGLSRFNPVSKKFKNFESNDGLQGNEFNRYAYCKTDNGWLFFGGVNGFTYFNPEEIQDQYYMPQVQITDFRIRNKSVSHRDKNSIISQPIYLTQKILLPYNENMISFEFASMDFAAPEKNIYQYMLEGFDKDWIQSYSAHAATYTNLDPGTYTFMVKAANNDGIWNETPAYIELVVLPPWYMTWWFRLLLVLGVSGLLYGIYRFRMYQTLKLQSIRNRIARDLHDEIGANLSSIRIFSEVAKEKSNDASVELKSWLTKITEYTQSSLDGINDIVWMINARNDRFENIFSRIRSLAVELLEARNFNLHIHFDETLEEVKLGIEERKNFYMICKEALNNIAKYADCKNVRIEVLWKKPEVWLLIGDDGRGFDLSAIEHGNGLINMKKRAELLKGKLQIKTRDGEGTTIELVFKI